MTDLAVGRRLSEILKRGAKSTWTRAIYWILGTLIVSISLAVAIAVAVSPYPSINVEATFISSFVVLLATLGLTNIFVIFRTSYPFVDPRTDLRYHSRVCHHATGEESEVLIKLHRTGNPKELEYTNDLTKGTIERGFPFLMAVVVFGASGMILTILYFLDFIGFAEWSMATPGWPLNLLSPPVAVLIMGTLCVILIYGILRLALILPWENYRKWRMFWIHYWEYVLNLLEPTVYGPNVSIESGSWINLTGWSKWGEFKNLNDDTTIQKIRELLRKKIEKNKLKDRIPDDMPDADVISYGDRLALFLHIKAMLEENRNALNQLSKRSPEFKKLSDEMKSVDSINGEAMKVTLEETLRKLRLIPVYELSLTILSEVDGITKITDNNQKEELASLAQSRLDVLWSLSHSPLPESIKWMGLFYSMASVLSAAILLIIGS
ncbi:MAG: hypothetical protein ACFFER_17500 [Candidatus Thorarchaeota archaeon]